MVTNKSAHTQTGRHLSSDSVHSDSFRFVWTIFYGAPLEEQNLYGSSLPRPLPFTLITTISPVRWFHGVLCYQDVSHTACLSGECWALGGGGRELLRSLRSETQQDAHVSSSTASGEFAASCEAH